MRAHALQGGALAVAVGVHGQRDDVLDLPLQVGQAVIADVVQPPSSPAAHGPATAPAAPGRTAIHGSPAALGAGLRIVLHANKNPQSTP